MFEQATPANLCCKPLPGEISVQNIPHGPVYPAGFAGYITLAIIIMSVPPNIDLFNRFSLAVFQKLYVSFPVSIELNVDDLMMSALPSDSSFGETFDALQVGGETLEFLSSEGFLTHKGALLDGSQFLQVRLTMKGLAILGSTPASLDKKESLMSKILAVTGKGLKDAASEQVQDLASQVYTFALASAPTIAAILPRP